MQKKVILVSLVISIIAEILAVAYTAHTRAVPAFGGEYLVLPLCVLCAYIVTEIMELWGHKEDKPTRLTRRTKSGRAVLNAEAFPEYDEETLINEVNGFAPIRAAVERLCKFGKR